MKYFLIILNIIFVVGCEGSTRVEVSSENVCLQSEDRKNLAKFIIDCAKAANPMSDEEGEDLVKQCEWTGIKTICPPVKVCRTVSGGGFLESYRFTQWSDCAK